MVESGWAEWVLTESARIMVLRKCWDFSVLRFGGMDFEVFLLGEIHQLAVEQYGKDWKYQTVSTYLRSLVKRGFLDMEPKGRGFDYTPRISEDEYLRAAMGELAGFWGKQSLNYLASAISESGGLTEQDIQELERLIHAPND